MAYLEPHPIDIRVACFLSRGGDSAAETSGRSGSEAAALCVQNHTLLSVRFTRESGR